MLNISHTPRWDHRGWMRQVDPGSAAGSFPSLPDGPPPPAPRGRTQVRSDLEAHLGHPWPRGELGGVHTMTDSKDLEAEIHPLKNENRKVQEHLGNPAGKETSVKPPPQSRLSRCRTVAFFLSLFVCLFVVFVVSFIIPCPDRPASQGVWRIDYKAAVAYDFLATEDVNKDRIQDVLFLYKNTNSSRSNFSLSCADEGETLWSRPSSFGGNVSVLSPLLRVPDVDADGVPDLLVLTQEENQVNGYVYSGGTGQQVGPPGSLGVDGTSGSILYVTSAGAHYVLIPCGTSLCSHSVKGLYEKATGRDSSLKSDPLWEGRLNATSHRLQEHSSGAVRYLMNVPGKVGEDLLLVSSEACVLLDGQELVPRWTLGAAQVLRKPILGYYKPDVPAMVIENGTGSERQILLLDLSSGAVLWSQALPGLPRDPQSASLPTADHRSAFFFWGLHELAGANQTEPGAAGHRLYMFHPTQPRVLLELANISTPIVTFQVVLLEPSRHAAYILLTGPASPDPPGLVSVAKHKVRDLIPSSKVVRLAEGGPDSDQAVRDRFFRLRYRNEA
ncbi:protein FAM234A isoform X2 [Mesoplodon densirostris]|uniref:protein FAM234A isoform X2 n=1 Tax=Mesoplodon densirostris TaxID=48708 RepID=UPI0028DCA05F|nr:protein FAM234A isoform X2 [Mesoplodon densirostris]